MRVFLLAMLMVFPALSMADPGLPLIVVQDTAGGGKNYSLTLQILALMTVLTLLPGVNKSRSPIRRTPDSTRPARMRRSSKR